MTVMEATSRTVMTPMTNLIILSLLNRILKEKLENRYLFYMYFSPAHFVATWNLQPYVSRDVR